MAHFYGKIHGKGKETAVSTRTGTANSGLLTEAMGYKGRIEVHIYHSVGQDYYTVYLLNHPDQPPFSKCIASGVLDTTSKEEIVNA